MDSIFIRDLKKPRVHYFFMELPTQIDADVEKCNVFIKIMQCQRGSNTHTQIQTHTRTRFHIIYHSSAKCHSIQTCNRIWANRYRRRADKQSRFVRSFFRRFSLAHFPRCRALGFPLPGTFPTDSPSSGNRVFHSTLAA